MFERIWVYGRISTWLAISVVNPMGNCSESEICRYHADLEILKASMCHNLSFDHLNEKSFEELINVSYKIHFSTSLVITRVRNVVNLRYDSYV